MPYSVVDDAAGCAGYAVVKDGTGEVMGCHDSESEAQAQLTALNIAEFGERFMTRALPDNYRPAVSVDVPEGRACGNCEHYKEDMIGPDGVSVWCELWADYVRGDYYCNRWEPDDAADQDEPEEEDDEDDDERSTAMQRSAPTVNLVRAASLERAADVDAEGRTLTGYFSVFDEWYEVNSAYEGRFMERISRGAFTETLARNADRIKVLYDHGADPSLGNKPLGRIMSMGEDKRGAYYEVSLINTDYNRDFIVPAARAGLLGSSFRFQVVSDDWREPRRATTANPARLPERTITAVDVFEFGPVTFPANPAVGAVAVRSGTDEWFDRLLHDPQFVARFTARVGLSNVERALEQAPTVIANATCDTVRSVDGPPDGRSDTPAQQPTDGRSTRTKNQRLAAVAKVTQLPPRKDTP